MGLVALEGLDKPSEEVGNRREDLGEESQEGYEERNQESAA